MARTKRIGSGGDEPSKRQRVSERSNFPATTSAPTRRSSRQKSKRQNMNDDMVREELLKVELSTEGTAKQLRDRLERYRSGATMCDLDFLRKTVPAASFTPMEALRNAEIEKEEHCGSEDYCSAFIIEFSIDPGSIRRGEVFVANSLTDALDPLKYEYCRRPVAWAANLTLSGGYCFLYVVEDGRIVETVDIRNYVTVIVPTFELEMPLSEWNRCTQTETERDDEVMKRVHYIHQYASNSLIDCEQTDFVSFEVDYAGLNDAIVHKELSGTVIEEGQTLELRTEAEEIERDGYISCVFSTGAQYGHNEYECLDRLCNPEKMT